MPETTAQQKIIRWLEAEMGHRVVEIAKQARWRPVWFVKTESGDREFSLVVRGDRLDARIGFTLEHEMRLQSLLHERGLPVPRVHGWMDDPRAYVMDRVEGDDHFGQATSSQRDAVMDAYMESLARIHALDVEPFARAGILRAKSPSGSGRIGLEVYEEAYRATKKRPDPLLEFSLAWLRRNPLPGRATESVVIWDTGQMLHADGELKAIIDLEIGHIGDPMMDLAGFRMRAREIGFSDFERLYDVYAKRGGQPVDRAAIQYYYFAFALCNQLAFHAALAEPPPGSDYMMNLRWCVETNLYAMEALAEILDVHLDPVPELEPKTSLADAAYTHLVQWLRQFESADAGQENEVRSAFRLARHLHRTSQIGEAAEKADLEELEPLLGRRPADWQAGDAALEEFVLTDGGEHDRALVRLFHGRLHRALMMLGPEGSAMARHHPVESLGAPAPTR